MDRDFEQITRAYVVTMGGLYNQVCFVLFFLSLQPQNILLTSDEPIGDIKIVDFGLSRMVSSNQEIREIMGTPEYVGKKAHKTQLSIFSNFEDALSILVF